jgi:hypothetical protein
MLPATKRRLNAWLFANGINYSIEDQLPTGEGERPVSFDLPVTGQGVPTSPAPGMDPNQLRMQGLPRQPDPNAVDASRLPPNRTAPAPAPQHRLRRWLHHKRRHKHQRLVSCFPLILPYLQ